MRVTLNVPAVVYVWAGFLSVLDVPSPKIQAQAEGFPVDVSANCTDWFTTGAAGETVNDATGTGWGGGGGGSGAAPQTWSVRVANITMTRSVDSFPFMAYLLSLGKVTSKVQPFLLVRLAFRQGADILAEDRELIPKSLAEQYVRRK